LAFTVSLWDAEDAETMPAVRDMTVGAVSAADLREFALRYHYTRSGGAIQYGRWGLWHGFTLLGVVSYNTPTQEARDAVFGREHGHRVWHMSRLVLADAAPRNSESRLIGGSLRAITSDHPDVWAVLTYAATDAGHLGYVYQATNAIYTGTGGDPVFYVDKAGKRWGTQLSDCKVRTAAQIAAAGWTRHVGSPKHRYVYILGSRTQRRQRMALLKLPSLPYPKASQAADILPR